MATILVVDDEEMIRFAFEQFLKDEGHTPLLARDGDQAMEMFLQGRPEVVFLDYRLPGMDGLEVLEKIRQADAKATVVLMTAFGAMDVAIQAMHLGAYDYLSKPLDLGAIRDLIHRILEGRRCLEERDRAEQTPAGKSALQQMVGKGPAMQQIFKMIGLLTTQDVTVLITGESGVGKELVAKAIHENSPRRGHPFVAVNCGAMPETLLEAEMFGYEKGAFTGADSRKPGKFEAADGGSILLDEIGELQPLLQVKLLRVLQEKSFERIGGSSPILTDARVIAATNRDLHREVMQGQFRKDLFYRLNLVNVHLPPLRERREDIPLLVDHFVHKANLELGRQVQGVTEETMERLIAYSWPGNVRELENQIKQAMVLSREDILTVHLFQLEHPTSSGGSASQQLERLAVQALGESLMASQRPGSPFDEVVATVEQAMIREALRRTDGNQMHAARLLGMSRSTLRKKKREYNLD